MKSAVRSLMLLACTATVAAQVPEAWRNWRYSAPVESLPAAAGQLVGVLVPAPVTAKARRDWTDLRVIDSKGREVPFILHARFGGESFVRHPVTLLEPTAVEGQYQQVVADAGEGTTTHNALRLTVQTDQNLLLRPSRRLSISPGPATNPPGLGHCLFRSPPPQFAHVGNHRQIGAKIVEGGQGVRTGKSGVSGRSQVPR